MLIGFGKFYIHKTINVIPLFEDKQYLLEAHHILSEYLKDKKFPYHRVFLARSDPALNYGMISAVLLIKISLQRLRKLSERLEKPIYPILGVGTVPF
ncbi:MAG: Phosphoenolpyruvate carboxylase [Candidatus Methanoperedenaceae archaeon GB50]|nr:MAG: Phosphoenolpyruvate carboxylase [Candidatus Methanoperedenaceae archaeon GB50]